MVHQVKGTRTINSPVVTNSDGSLTQLWFQNKKQWRDPDLAVASTQLHARKLSFMKQAHCNEVKYLPL